MKTSINFKIARISNILSKLLKSDYYFRAIMVVNPLHYKRLVTKRKLYFAYISMFISLTIVFVIGFLFFRQEKFIVIKTCSAAYILQHGFYLYVVMPVIAVFIMTMLISYIIVTVELKQRSKQIGRASGDNANDINSKIMKASWFVLSAFLILYTQLLLLILGSNFLVPPFLVNYLVIKDIVVRMFFLNNLINPFFYYKILSNFREGYKRLFTCGKFGRNNSNNQVYLGTISTSSQ